MILCQLHIPVNPDAVQNFLYSVYAIVAAHTIENITKIIKGAMLYALQRFHYTRVLCPEFFQGKETFHNESELFQLKTLAAPWVKKCIVR